MIYVICPSMVSFLDFKRYHPHLLEKHKFKKISKVEDLIGWRLNPETDHIVFYNTESFRFEKYIALVKELEKRNWLNSGRVSHNE